MYFCNLCSRTFGRNWNYKRHVIRKHPEIATIQGLDNQKLGAIAPLKAITKTTTKPDSEEQIIQRMYIDLHELMEKLDKFMQVTPQTKKNQMLSGCLTTSLSSDDPVKQLEGYTHSAYANYCKVNLINYIAKGNGIKFPGAMAIFENLINNN